MATILCIDDHRQSLVTRKALLELKGYTVVTANNGPQGVELARSTHVDLVLLDYKMPEMDGAEVARILKKEQPALKIILLSACCSADIPRELLFQVEAYLQKGEHISKMLSAVERALYGMHNYGRRQNESIHDRHLQHRA